MLLFKTSGETYCAVPTNDLLRDLDLSPAFSKKNKIHQNNFAFYDSYV